MGPRYGPRSRSTLPKAAGERVARRVGLSSLVSCHARCSDQPDGPSKTRRRSDLSGGIHRRESRGRSRIRRHERGTGKCSECQPLHCKPPVERVAEQRCCSETSRQDSALFSWASFSEYSLTVIQLPIPIHALRSLIA